MSDTAGPFVCFKSTISDNMFYALVHAGRCWLVDPLDSAQAIEWLAQQQLELAGILNTHWHPDHVGGNAAVLAAHPEAKTYASADEVEAFAQASGQAPDVLLDAGDTVECGAHVLHVLGVPGHTQGHIAYALGDDILSGDVLFRAGAGHCWLGGDPGVLFATYRDVLRTLAPHTRLYPGHDYTQKNLAMARDILPDDPAIAHAWDAAQGYVPRSEPVVRLSEQLRTNLFLRYDDEALARALRARFDEAFQAQRALSASEHEGVWRTLRALRDIWNGESFE